MKMLLSILGLALAMQANAQSGGSSRTSEVSSDESSESSTHLTPFWDRTGSASKVTWVLGRQTLAIQSVEQPNLALARSMMQTGLLYNCTIARRVDTSVSMAIRLQSLSSTT